MNRREFMAACAGAAGMAALPVQLLAQDLPQKLHSDRIKLGPKQVS